MEKNKIRSFVVILFLIFVTSGAHASINNSVIISVGNLPITYLDLVKEMKIISIISNNKIDDSNKEQIKGIAVKTLIKRKIKEIEINKYNIKDYSRNDIEKLIMRT